MKVGLISDTHDNLPQIEKAVGFFNDKGVNFVIHAGDFVAPFSVALLSKLNCDWVGVYGNNDGEKEGLLQKSDGRIKGEIAEVELEGKRILVIHDLSKYDGKEADVVVFGHTHKAEVKREGGRLFVNPGECGGWLYGKSTVAILDLSELKVDFIEL